MDDNALLRNVIQLVVLIIPLFFILPVLRKTGEAAGQLGNAANKFAGALRADKGLDKLQGGMRGVVKNKALNAEARMASSDSRVGRGIGGARTRKRMKQQNRERVRSQALEEGYYKNLTSGTQRQQDEKRARAVGVGGRIGADEAERLGRQATGYATAKEYERFGETVKFQEAELSTKSTAELGRILEDALRSGNDERAHAASNTLVGRGKADAAVAGEAIRTVAGGAAPDSKVAESAASLVRSHGADFNAVSPDLTRWASQDMSPSATGVPAPTLNDRAADAGTYANASAEKMSTWTPDTVARAYQAATTTGNIADHQRLVDQAHATLNDPQAAGRLDQRVKDQLLRISQGQAIPPPPPPPPPPSDRRLKKNISRVGSYGDIPLYRFQYKWGSTEYVGTMAQDIAESHADAISVGSDGYYRVDYSQLGFDMTTYEEWSSKK